MPGNGYVFRDHRRHLSTACFQDGDVDAGIFAEPRGDGGAGRARADDDIIVIGHLPLPFAIYGCLWSTNGWNGRLSWIVRM